MPPSRNTRKTLEILLAGSEDVEDQEVRQDWIIIVAVPRKVEKIQKRLTSIIAKQGWRKYCTLPEICDAPYQSIGLSVNTYKKVIELIVRLPYISEAWAMGGDMSIALHEAARRRTPLFPSIHDPDEI